MSDPLCNSSGSQICEESKLLLKTVQYEKQRWLTQDAWAAASSRPSKTSSLADLVGGQRYWSVASPPALQEHFEKPKPGRQVLLFPGGLRKASHPAESCHRVHEQSNDALNLMEISSSKRSTAKRKRADMCIPLIKELPPTARSSLQSPAQGQQNQFQQDLSGKAKFSTARTPCTPMQELHEENQGELPNVFKDSIDVLRRRGLRTKGLFKGSAEGRKVQLMVRAWDQGHNPLKIAKIQDCCAVAESLLQWLRALPGPLIPCRLFRAFLQTQNASCQAERLSELHLLFQQLEGCEYQAVIQLLGLLHDYVLAQAPENFICPTLGQTFGPLILRGSEGPLPLPFPEDVRATAELVDYMINDYSIVFDLHSPCSSPCHKPPSRARSLAGCKRNLCAAAPSKSKSQAIQKSQAILAANETWPTKHLRVNVVPPMQDSEVCCVSPEFSGFPEESSMLNDTVPMDASTALEEHSQNETLRSGLATVPEGRPFVPYPEPQEPELDDLVGKLLCGSMESMLFENNDDLFLARTSSLMSISSLATPRHHGSCGESTDMSSDDEHMIDSPYSTQHRGMPPRHVASGFMAENSEYSTWLSLQST